MRRSLAVLAVVLLGACTPKRPPQPPTPPPEPPRPVTITTGLLRASGGQFLRDGQPFDPFPSIWCCSPEPERPERPPRGWPMIDGGLIERARSLTPGARKANWFEMRPGPFVSTSEPEYPGIGAYLGDTVGGGVNPALLAKLDEQVIAAGQVGAVAMVVLVDCWYCRHYEIPHPWDGTAARASCGVALEEWQRRWIEAVVLAVGRHHNVAWLDGNECDVNPGYDGTYGDQVQQLVRSVEAQNGFPVHMFGTQSRCDMAQSGKADFVVLHDGVFADQPRYGKPTLVLEYNPNPPYTAAIMNAQRCGAKNAGTHWGYWRHEMTWPEWVEAHRLASDGSCEGVGIGGCPVTPAPTMALRCKRHGDHGGYPLFDCTPVDGYGRPVWPEGNAEIRSACERESMGGEPDFAFAPGAPLKVHHLAHGGLAFAVEGVGTASVGCAIPKPTPGFKGCENPVVTVP